MSLIKINQLLPTDVFPIYLKQQEQVDMQLLLYRVPLTEIPQCVYVYTYPKISCAAMTM